MGLRRQIRQATPSSSTKKRSPEIEELRSGDLLTTSSTSFLKLMSAQNVLKCAQKQAEIFGQLQCNGLAKILIVLGKPSYIGINN